MEIDPEEYQLELQTIQADVNQSEKMLQEAVEEIVQEVKQTYKRTVRTIDESHAAKLFEKFIASLRN